MGTLHKITYKMYIDKVIDFEELGSLNYEIDKHTNQRVIEELESLKKGIIPKIRIKYQIGHYQSKDTQRFIEGVRSSVIEINNRIKELKTK